MTAHPVRWVGECERCGVLLDERDTRELAEADAENCPCQSAEVPSADEATPLPLTSRERELLAGIIRRGGGGTGRAVWPEGFAALSALERAGLVTVEWDGSSGPVLAYPCQNAEEPADGSTPPLLTSRARGLLAVIRVDGGTGHPVYPAAFDALGELERAGLVTVEWDDTLPWALAYPTERAES